MKILFGRESRLKIKEGVDKCVDAVKVSLGHNGKNVLISNGNLVDIINDGVTIAKFIDSDNKVELAGIRLAQQGALITNRDAGDGTTSTMVLLQSFLNELLDETQLEKARVLRKRVLESVDKVCEKLDKSAKKVKVKEDLFNLAKTASLDDKIASIITEMFWKLGVDTSITIDESRYDILESEVVEGFRFSSKNMNVYKDPTVTLTNIPIIVMKKTITSEDIIPKIDELNKLKESGAIFIGNDFTPDAQGFETKFNAKGLFKIQLVKDEESVMEDLEFLGNKSKKVIITRENTTIIGYNGDVKTQVKKLNDELEKEESEFKREQLKIRISRLSSGVSIITVGGKTDLDREERKLKIEDAINAVKTGMKHGYVKGGGMALKECGEKDFQNVYDSIYKQICENSDEEVKVNDEVVDSLLVVKTSLKTAASIATSILTMEAALIEDDNNETTTDSRPSEEI